MILILIPPENYPYLTEFNEHVGIPTNMAAAKKQTTILLIF